MPGSPVSISTVNGTRNIIMTTSMQQADLLHKPVHQFSSMPSSIFVPDGSGIYRLNSQINEQLSLVSTAKSSTIFQRLLSHISSSGSRTEPLTGTRFLSNVADSSMSRREVAEIQLYAILNDPEESLPSFVRGAQMMSLKEVSKHLNTPPFIVERLSNVLSSLSAQQDSSSMSQKNVIKLTRVLNGTVDVRVLLFFMMLDENVNNYVTRDEMNHFLELYLKSISCNSDHLQEAIETLLHRFQFDTNDEIDFEEFYSIVTKDLIILKSFSQFAVNPTWFVPPLSPPRSNSIQRCCANLCWYSTCYNRHKSKLTPKYLNNHLPRIIIFILYLLTNLALALYVVIYRSTVRKDHVFVVLARTSGMLLNLNCVLVLLLMLKQTIVFIRSNQFLRRWIPVDDHIDFHRYVGRFIAGLVVCHTIAHVLNFRRLDGHSWSTYMFTRVPEIGWVSGLASISGIVLCFVLAIMVISSMNWIRYRGYFQIFYWTHRLYLVFFVFLILHAKDFWKWSIGPLVWFFLEKVYSIVARYSSRNGRTSLHSVTIEQSNVVSLNIHRPKHFHFKPGDYININLPHVAFYEFHPFTISSAPEEEEILRVHIQASGHWTKRVYQRFKDMSENRDSLQPSIPVYRADLNPAQERNPNSMSMEGKKEVVIINGPYSSCARYIFDCRHAVLIAGGIGVTPYASILSSLMAQFRASRTASQHGQGANYDRRILLENHQIRKVDFIWISRDHKSFEWFFSLLHQFEEEQDAYLASNPSEHRFLTIHLYFTEMKDDQYIGHYPLQLITRVWAEVTGTDIFTGLKARTHIGRPPWNKIFHGLCSGENASTASDVNVFFCGPAVMGQTIQEHCTEHSFRFYKESF